MAGREGRLSRLERRNAGGMVRIHLRDGSTRAFLESDFWEQLFISELDALVGKRTPTAVSLALEAATPESLAEVHALIRDDGGDFLRAATADGFGDVQSPIPELSDAPEGPP